MLLDELTKSSSGTKSTAGSQPVGSGFFVITLISALLMGLIGGAVMLMWGNQFLPRGGYVTSGISSDKNSSSATQQTVQVEEESATTDVVKKVSPSVVSIIISKDLSKLYNATGPQPFDLNPFGMDFPFNFFFGNGSQQPATPAPQGKQQIGGGTGFVINQAKGLILTNRHVVEDTEADYTVLTNDGRKFDARVVARDSVSDLALVQISDKSLPQVTLGDSDKVLIGQTVIAIGNALGEYRNTVTKGVISGIGRNVTAGDNRGSSENLEGVFQTDAAINPGNSGGPLVNIEGQVIGINTAVNQSGQLIGFALPVNEAKRMLASYDKYGKIVRPYLGIRYINVTPELAKANKLEVDYGALIIRGKNANELAVVPGSPADKAGLVENDIILEASGQKIDAEHSLVKLLSKYSPGDKVKLKVYHKGARKDVEVTLEEFKEPK